VKIVCYVPTYSQTEAEVLTRPYTRLSTAEIMDRTNDIKNRSKPGMYFDVIDSIINNPTKVDLIVSDGRSTDSIRDALLLHQRQSGGYELKLYPEKMSQWLLFNDIYNEHKDADYFIYNSSDVIWHMDWVVEAIKEFEKNPRLQILFPCVNKGDPNLPCQIAKGVRDLDPILPPYQDAAKARVLNAYAMIFKMDFLHQYGGYPNVYRNCFTESFLAYMCQAIGGEMRVMPRGHVFHWSEGDKWGQEVASPYYYNEEKFAFQSMINELLMCKAMNMMNKDYLKKKLYK